MDICNHVRPIVPSRGPESGAYKETRSADTDGIKPLITSSEYERETGRCIEGK